jgi:anti-anti-sigma factor
MRLTTVRATRTATVVVVAGEVDLVTAPRLAALLEPRLASTLPTLVIDLTAVTFLGAAGLHVLANAHQRASLAGRTLRVITGPSCVNRTLDITGLSNDIACHPA